MTRVAGVDQGTTGTKTCVLARDGQRRSIPAIEHQQHYPRAGWVEHDAAELVRSIVAQLEQAGELDAIGIANQGETVVAWDAVSKQPIGRAIVWQDVRTQDTILRLKASGAEALTLERAGLPLDPYFSASKLAWMSSDFRNAARA